MEKQLQIKHHDRLHRAKVIAKYAIRNPIDFTKKSIKIYKDAKTNVSEGGAAVSSALFIGSLSMPLIIPPLTYLLQEVVKNTPANIVSGIAVGLVGLSSIMNIPLEAQALRKKGITNSIPGSATYLLTKSENVTAFLMNFYHIAILSGLNGLSIQVLNTLMGNQGKFFASGLISTSIILSIWNNITLRPIISGKIDPFVEKVNDLSEKAKNKIVEKIPLKAGNFLFGDPVKNFRFD